MPVEIPREKFRPADCGDRCSRQFALQEHQARRGGADRSDEVLKNRLNHEVTKSTKSTKRKSHAEAQRRRERLVEDQNAMHAARLWRYEWLFVFFVTSWLIAFYDADSLFNFN